MTPPCFETRKQYDLHVQVIVRLLPCCAMSNPYFQGGGSSNASSEDPGGTNTPDRSLPGGGGRRSDNFCDDNATGTVDGEDVTDTVFGKGKGKEKQRPSTRPPWTGEKGCGWKFLQTAVREIQTEDVGASPCIGLPCLAT